MSLLEKRIMRLYIKLAVLILVTVAVQCALPSAVRLSHEASFALRCGIASWSGDEQLRAELVDEAREMRRLQTQRSLAGSGR